MKSFEYTITDPDGLHAHPAGVLAKEAKNMLLSFLLPKVKKTLMHVN